MRTLRKSPGFAAVAVLTLAIGIGANTAIFSFVNGVLLKPLPYGEPERIVRVLEKPPGGGPQRHLDAELSRLAKRKHRLRVHGRADRRLGDAHGRQRAGSVARGRGCRRITSISSASQPALGRTFAADEDQSGKERVAVLSHALWDSQFGADPNVIGRSITLDGAPAHRDRRPAGGRRVRPGLRADLAAAGVRAAEHDAQLSLVRRLRQAEARRHA